MNAQTITKILGFMAVLALVFSLSPTTVYAGQPSVNIIGERCVDGDGVVEFKFNWVDEYVLTNLDTGTIESEGDTPGDKGDFKTFADLADGNYELEFTGDGYGTYTKTFTVDCDEDEKEPELEITQKCTADKNNSGEITVTAPNGLDSYDLFRTDTNPNTSIASGTNVATGNINDDNFKNLADGNYRFEGTLGNNSETLTFTFDCYEKPQDELTGQCDVSPRNVETSENVTWSADASGGDGPYTFSWNLEGSDDDDDTQDITTSYSSEGTFDGTVLITDSNNDQIQRTCSVRVEDDNGGGGGGPPLDPKDPDDNGRVRGDRDVFSVQCLPENSAYLVGEVVTFSATVDGDIDEDDADFSWSGHNSIDEDGERATVQYTTTGIKEVAVEAEYDGDVERDTCFVQIARSGVTLDRVPYTGPGDTAKTVGFIMTLILLAGAGAHTMIRRREEVGIPVGIPTKRN